MSEDIPITDVFDKNEVVDMINSFLPEDKKVSYTNADNLTKLIDIFGRIINNTQGNGRERNIKQAREWLNYAQEDLKSSKVLFKSKQYRNSMSDLQQSVEKLVKAYALAFFIISEKDFKKIGHKTPLAFVEMVKHDWVEPCVGVMKEHYPDLNTNTKPLVKAINNKQHELALTSEQAIDVFLKLCINLENALVAKNVEIRAYIKQIVDAFAPMIKKEQLKKLRKLQRTFDIRIATSFINLYLMSAITYPHISYRYPDTKVKREAYNESLGIVKKAPEIYMIIKSSMVQLDKYLKLIEKQKGANNG